MLKATFMRDSGRMVWQTAKGYLFMKAVHNIKDHGRMICRMAKAMKFGQTDLHIRLKI